MDRVAHQLAISARSLHRQLAAEGTSYHRLLDTLRRDEAIRQALDLQRPLKTIAAAIGFSDPRAFRRAFKRWTGVTPQQFRADRAAEAHATGATASLTSAGAANTNAAGAANTNAAAPLAAATDTTGPGPGSGADLDLDADADLGLDADADHSADLGLDAGHSADLGLDATTDDDANRNARLGLGVDTDATATGAASAPNGEDLADSTSSPSSRDP